MRVFRKEGDWKIHYYSLFFNIILSKIIFFHRGCRSVWVCIAVRSFLFNQPPNSLDEKEIWSSGWKCRVNVLPFINREARELRVEIKSEERQGGRQGRRMRGWRRQGRQGRWNEEQGERKAGREVLWKELGQGSALWELQLAFDRYIMIVLKKKMRSQDNESKVWPINEEKKKLTWQ